MANFVAYYKDRKIFVEGSSALEARNKAALHFRVSKRPWDVTVFCTDSPISTCQLPGA
jgi:hypothetical protein